MAVRFTDAVLIGILQKAARRVNRRLRLTGTSNEISVDGSGNMSSSNSDLEDILLLQAECMISSREFQEDLANGTAGLLSTDGEQTLDTRGQTVARGTFFESTHSPCSELNQAIVQYQLDNMTGRLVW